VVLKNLSKYLPKRTADSDDDEDQLPSWAIRKNPSELEGKLWAKRRVGIFDLPLDEFVSKMREQAER
jgi:hypothetical protein